MFTIIIKVETEEQRKLLNEVLREAEENGDVDFPFGVQFPD